MPTSKLNHFTQLERAHVDLVRALSVLPPHRIIGEADIADVEARADHLQSVNRLFWHYLDAVLTDTVNHIAGDGDVDWQAVEVAMWDALNDIDFAETAAALDRAGVRFDGTYQNDRSEAA